MTDRFHVSAPVRIDDTYLVHVRRAGPHPAGGAASGPTAAFAQAQAMTIVQEALAWDAAREGSCWQDWEPPASLSAKE